MWETKTPGFCSTSGTRHHPTLLKHLHLQHTSANTANVLHSGSGTHWDDASNQAAKRPLSLPTEEEVVAESVVPSGKGLMLKRSLNAKPKWAQSCSGTWSVTSFCILETPRPTVSSTLTVMDAALEPTRSLPSSHTQLTVTAHLHCMHKYSECCIHLQKVLIWPPQQDF